MSPSELPRMDVIVCRLLPVSQVRAPKVRGHTSLGHRPGFWEAPSFLSAAGPIYALQHVATWLVRIDGSLLKTGFSIIQKPNVISSIAAGVWP